MNIRPSSRRSLSSLLRRVRGPSDATINLTGLEVSDREVHLDLAAGPE